MGWIKDLVEIRSVLSQGDTGSTLLNSLLKRDMPVTEDQAMNIPTVAGCVEFIANNVAALPVRLYKRENGEVHEITDDHRIHLLNNNTGDVLSGWQWKKAITRDYLLHGAGYAYMKRKSNKVQSLHYVKCSNVAVNVGADPIEKNIDILVNGKRYREFEFLKVTRNTVDGATGRGVLAENGQMLTLARAALLFEKVLMQTGGSKKGYLSAKSKLSDGAMDELKEQFREMYSNDGSAVIVLNHGLEFKEASSTAVELQLNEAKEANGIELCRIFNLSPSVLAGTAKDDEHIQAIKTAVLPVVDAFTGALNKDLLLASESGSYFFAFDTRNLLKGDVFKRFQAWKLAVDANIMQIDEAREEENLPPLGLKFVKLGLSDVLFNPKEGTVFVPNTGISSEIEQRPGIARPTVPPMEGGEKDENRDSQ